MIQRVDPTPEETSARDERVLNIIASSLPPQFQDTPCYDVAGVSMIDMEGPVTYSDLQGIATWLLANRKLTNLDDYVAIIDPRITPQLYPKTIEQPGPAQRWQVQADVSDGNALVVEFTPKGVYTVANVKLEVAEQPLTEPAVVIRHVLNNPGDYSPYTFVLYGNTVEANP